jgi:hypothetical protein
VTVRICEDGLGEQNKQGRGDFLRTFGFSSLTFGEALYRKPGKKKKKKKKTDLRKYQGLLGGTGTVQ